MFVHTYDFVCKYVSIKIVAEGLADAAMRSRDQVLAGMSLSTAIILKNRFDSVMEMRPVILG